MGELEDEFARFLAAPDLDRDLRAGILAEALQDALESQLFRGLALDRHETVIGRYASLRRGGFRIHGVEADRAVVGEYLVALDAPPQAALLGGASIEHLGFGIYRIIDNSTSIDAITRAQELSDALGAVVEPNRVSYLLGDNTEPDAFNQWTLENTAQFVPN